MGGGDGKDLVKVGLRFHDDEMLPEAEWLWAQPVNAHDGGGVYELQNCSYYAPLALRDLVRAQVNGDGLLQVTALVCPGPMAMSRAVVAPRYAEQVVAIADAWLTRGSWGSQATDRLVTTMWKPGVSRREIERATAEDLAVRRLEWLEIHEPDDRTEEAMEIVDLTLDTRRRVEEVTTTYWAADDPYWAEAGLAEPEFLAHVQALAGLDAELARSLERGEHDLLLEVLDFIAGMQPPRED